MIKVNITYDDIVDKVNRTVSEEDLTDAPSMYANMEAQYGVSIETIFLLLDNAVQGTRGLPDRDAIVTIGVSMFHLGILVAEMQDDREDIDE